MLRRAIDPLLSCVRVFRRLHESMGDKNRTLKPPRGVAWKPSRRSTRQEGQIAETYGDLYWRDVWDV